MAGVKPVSISDNAFAFCRYGIAIMVWISWIFRVKELLLAVFIILLSSAVMKVRRAPMIMIYKYTIGTFYPGENVIVDEKGMRFAHAVGAVVSGICVILLYTGFTGAGLMLTFVLALLKTSAAFGYCSALKLYSCMNSGTCCRVGNLVRKFKHD
ncbi:MAG: DUF4395 domain-containing protein [Eubacteriaceae bacterium]|nr:DUF4395 domain-containing protein [Eubacteriaceae bacterium]